MANSANPDQTAPHHFKQDLRKLNQDYNEIVCKHSVAEATLEVALKVFSLGSLGRGNQLNCKQ